MDVISDHSEGPGEPPPATEFEHRIRWGNVALALAALVAIAAAVGLPHGSGAEPAQQSAAPVTELVTAPTPPPRAPSASERRPRRATARRAEHKPAGPKKAGPARPLRPAPVTPAPVQTPAPAPPAPDQTPAAEREFGL